MTPNQSFPDLPPEILTQITEEVFTGMLCLPVDFSSEFHHASLDWNACVDYSGACHGEFRIETNTSGATLVSKALLPEGVETNPAWLVDSLGEIANIFAGSLKAVLPNGLLLSPPRKLGTPIGDPLIAGSCRFEAAGQPFLITLLTTNP